MFITNLHIIKTKFRIMIFILYLLNSFKITFSSIFILTFSHAGECLRTASQQEHTYSYNSIASRPAGLVVRVHRPIGVVIYETMTPQYGRPVVQVLAVKVDIRVVTYEAMTPQCGRSVVGSGPGYQSGVVIYEAMTAQCGRSVVQVLVVRVDIGVVIYEAMTQQCGRIVVQVLVVIVDIGVVIYEAMTPSVGGQWFRS